MQKHHEDGQFRSSRRNTGRDKDTEPERVDKVQPGAAVSPAGMYGPVLPPAGSVVEERDFFDRAADEITSLFGDEVAHSRREDDLVGATSTDEILRAAISDALIADLGDDALEIEVNVTEGEVTLSGRVATLSARQRAEAQAEALSGVTTVQNNLRIRQQPGDVTPKSALP